MANLSAANFITGTHGAVGTGDKFATGLPYWYTQELGGN
jgi:hypothetical protein